ncbi:hypothetical protein SAMN04487981_105354 [Streptomyces sp. cf386]|uniref:hypothetical protein n=1 Tax=Streptomyces sp. cf386 TaxID=1761904 RepID=UPI00088B119B|nr:hypothetical protein [Streptomyces sp. cf386]SDN53213.1 hypothetical protein SAMN04487981_105354 [Streptomyces sp. cf386]
MPQPPVRPDRSVRSDRSDGEFAELFARKARTPLRGFLPGRRVWNAVGGSAAVVLVIAGSASVVSAIDWSSGDSDKVTTAADKKVPEASASGEDVEKPTVVPSPKEEDSGKKNPEVVYVPVQGGTGGGGAAAAPESTATSGSAGTSGGGSQEDQDSSSTDRSAQSATTTGYLWSDGSVGSDTNDYWDQSTVTVKSTKPLTSLKVVVKIIQTGGVTNTGTWSSVGDKVSVSAAASSGELDYVVTLKSGNTLDPGTYVFKFQYNHNQGGRDAGGDRYNVTTTSADSATEFRKGAF